MQPGQQLIGGFDPRSVPWLELWLDAADSNTITVTSGYVSRWMDKSSNGYTFSNAATTGTTGPTRTTTQNGLDVLTFTATSATDAAGQYLDNTTTSSFNLSTHTIFLVHRPTLTNGANYGDTNLFTAVSDASGVLFPFSGAAGALGYSNSHYTVQYPVNDVSTAYNLSVATIAYTGGQITRNGAQQTYIDIGTVRDVSIAAANRIGARPGATPSNFYSGTVAEILVYRTGVPSAKRRDIEGYLAWKWGLQSNLPATGSYSSNPPLARPFLPTDLERCIVWFDAADPRTLTTTGTTVTQWVNKGTLDICAGGSVGTVSTGFTFTTSSLNAVQFPGTTYLRVNNVVTTTPARTQFFIFSVTSYGDGYSRIFASSNTTSNQQAQFIAWNRDTNTINFFPATYSATEYVGTIGSGSAPYSGTLPYDGTPFVIGIRHTGGRASNAIALRRAISVNGKVATLNVDLPLVSGYLVGTDNFVLGTGPGYGNVQRIGEVIQYDRALADDEMREVEGYLCWKWNVTIADTVHPFYRIPPSTPAVFLPSFMPGCVLWLDAADTATLTTAGSSVTAWRDKSGRNNTITFAASPTTGSVQQNGNNVLVFSSARGSNSNFFISVGGHTLIAVHNPTTTAQNTNLFRFWDGTSTADRRVVFPYYTTSNAGWQANDGTNSIANQPDGSPAGSYSLITASVGVNAYQVPTSTVSPLVEVFRDGVRVRASNQTIRGDISSGTFNLGATSVGTEYYSGNVCELLVFNGKLSNQSRLLVEGYLAKKWGL